MRKILLIMAVGLMCLTACAQREQGAARDGMKGTPRGGGMKINKDSDSAFVALKNDALDKFKQFTFKDPETGKTMEYNLMVPEGCDANHKLPLLLFMADASTVGKEVTAPLTQGYGALVFAGRRMAEKILANQ